MRLPGYLAEARRILYSPIETEVDGLDNRRRRQVLAIVILYSCMQMSRRGARSLNQESQRRKATLAQAAEGSVAPSSGSRPFLMTSSS